MFVLAQAAVSAAILAQADQTNGAGWFNGDDAVVLRKGTTIIDAIGQVGFDPGTEWGTGLQSTADNTLRRKASVMAGDTSRQQTPSTQRSSGMGLPSIRSTASVHTSESIQPAAARCRCHWARRGPGS